MEGHCMSPHLEWHFVGSVPENYERHLVPSIFGPWASDLVEVAGIRLGERVLDIACGTGVVARTAARRVGSGGTVVGLDVSAPMLDVARSVAAGEGVSIEWRGGGGRRGARPPPAGGVAGPPPRAHLAPPPRARPRCVRCTEC